MYIAWHAPNLQLRLKRGPRTRVRLEFGWLGKDCNILEVWKYGRYGPTKLEAHDTYSHMHMSFDVVMAGRCTAIAA